MKPIHRPLLLFFYKLGIFIYWLGVRFSSLWNSKARAWVDGRRHILEEIETKDLDGCIWIHSSSLGEFEQVSYLIKKLKEQNISSKIVITFFSPSGFEQRKYFSDADHICYLPWDGFKDIFRFIDKLNPKIVVWVRYDFWLRTLLYLKRKNIPIMLLNGVFRKDIFWGYSPILNMSLSCFERIFTINESSRHQLLKLGYDSEILPDSRYDRVAELRGLEFNDEKLEHFLKGNKAFICGSIYDEEDLLIKMNLDRSKYWILIPHEVDSKRIEQMKIRFSQSQVYSHYDFKLDSRILIIDTIGLLAKLYRYASHVYVGGGFRKVVHSLSEPLAYGCPILVGPNTSRSEEAIQYEEKGFIVKTSKEHFSRDIEAITAVNSDMDREQRLIFFNSQLGSSNKITSIIKNYIHF